MEKQTPQYLTFDQLRAKLGNRGRTSIYRDVDHGRLPKPMKIGARCYWIEATVDAHIQHQNSKAIAS